MFVSTMLDNLLFFFGKNGLNFKKGTVFISVASRGDISWEKLNPDFDLRIETLNLDFIFFVHYFKGFSLSKTPTTTYDLTKIIICLSCSIEKLGKRKKMLSSYRQLFNQTSSFSDGVGRSGTYALIDMVLNRLSKGCKEIGKSKIVIRYFYVIGVCVPILNFFRRYCCYFGTH